MEMKARVGPVMVAVLSAVVVGGCAGDSSQKRYEGYRQVLTPMVAVATREDCVRKFGIPTRKEQLGTLEVWQYAKAYGAKTVGYSGGKSDVPGVESGFADDLTLIFDADGRLQSWRAEVRQ